MTRYIDADALKDYIDCGHLRPPTELCFSELDVCNMIDEAPTADVVEVVRCKDCKNASTTGYLYCTNDGIAECQSVYCGHYKIYMELNHYCSHGERRGGEDE